MAGGREGAARKQQNGVAVSSGESSAALPKPALGPDGAPRSATDGSDATLIAPAVPASDPSDARTIVGKSHSDVTPSVANSVFKAIGATVFEDGAVLGGRYEIHKLLGMGGMGAVYKARDLEVDRVVGLKVIRPDLAGNPAILARFKQELVLARQVTHKNIIRIYDLNEADGVKFITMEFIEGEDLRSILTRQKKLLPVEAVGIMLQTCAGLQAMHVEGIVHRDMKPSNIMRDTAGRVLIMDFGLAKTVQGDGLTQTGMMIGTMEYMSPEQAMGSELDARSDIFAIGLIFYELLTGYIPFRADSAIASLVKRTQERAVPLVDVDSSIPSTLSEIVSKCLERDPKNRYSSAQELIEELEVWQGKPRPMPSRGQTPTLRPTVVAPAIPKPFAWKWVATAVAALLLCGGVGTVVWQKYFSNSAKSRAAQGPVMSVAILPYQNATADASLNWLGASISETLSSDIGRSAHLRMVSPSRLQQVLRDMHVSPASPLDQSMLRRIADFTNADTVVFGQYVKAGEQIRISSTITDLKHDSSPVDMTNNIASERELLGGLDTLAKDIRQKLAATPEILNELQGHSNRVPTESIPALRAYQEGMQLYRASNSAEARLKFEKATTQDPNFALAFSRLAETYSRLGLDDKADIASRRAVALSDNLSTADRYLIQASHYRIVNDTPKAIEAYENLTKANPDDLDAQFTLAGLYMDASEFDQARQRLKLVLDADSKNVDALVLAAKVEILSDKPQAALDYLNRGLSNAIQFDNQEVKATIYHLMGNAYASLNKPEDALRNLQDALAIRQKNKNPDGKKAISQTLNTMAGVLDSLGRSSEALAAYKDALGLRREIGDKKGIGLTLLNLGAFYADHGKYAEALPLYTEALLIERDLTNESLQAQILNNLGTLYSHQGDYQTALTNYQQSYQLREKLGLKGDMAEALHNLAETNAQLGQYETAMTQNLKALELYRSVGDQKGAATVSSSLGALYDAQGQYDRALSARQSAVEFFKVNDHTAEAVEAVGGYGVTLSQMGRADEGQKSIEDALKMANDMKNDSLTALVLNWLGDSYFYRGDLSGARQQYDRALQAAQKSGDEQRVALARFNQSKIDVWQGHSQAAVAPLQKLVQQTDTLGLRSLSVKCSVYLAEALLSANKIDAAQRELDKAINRAEKLDLRLEQAHAKYVLAQVLTRTGKAKEAIPEYREAVRLLEAIGKEDGAARFLERADVKDMYRDASKAYQGGM
jgi:serine/threonine protein kinase/tetratricopeptide (TPR) repeat protein